MLLLFSGYLRETHFFIYIFAFQLRLLFHETFVYQFNVTLSYLNFSRQTEVLYMNDIENNIIIFIIIPFYFMNFIYILKKAPKKTLNHITLATICFNVFYLHSYIVIVDVFKDDPLMRFQYLEQPY